MHKNFIAQKWSKDTSDAKVYLQSSAHIAKTINICKCNMHTHMCLSQGLYTEDKEDLLCLLCLLLIKKEEKIRKSWSE